jgi:hypothetical protein
MVEKLLFIKENRMSDAKDVMDHDEHNPVDHQESKSNTEDTVKYETYDKTLKRLKKKEAEARDLESRYFELLEEKKQVDLDRKKKEEAKLAEQGEWKKLLEARERELQDFKEKFENQQSEILERDKVLNEATKLQAFINNLPGKVVKDDYLSFVDIDKIAIENGKVDSKSVEFVVNDFMKNHPTLFSPSKITKLPGEAARPSSAITYEEWRRLPLREQKNHLQDIVNADKT